MKKPMTHTRKPKQYDPPEELENMPARLEGRIAPAIVTRPPVPLPVFIDGDMDEDEADALAYMPRKLEGGRKRCRVIVSDGTRIGIGDSLDELEYRPLERGDSDEDTDLEGDREATAVVGAEAGAAGPYPFLDPMIGKPFRVSNAACPVCDGDLYYSGERWLHCPVCDVAAVKRRTAAILSGEPFSVSFGDVVGKAVRS